MFFFRKKEKRLDMADVNVYTAARLADLAASLSCLAKSFTEEIDGQHLTREDGAAAMQTAAAMVCGSCSRCNLYQDSAREDSYYLYYLLRAFEVHGAVRMEDMPLSSDLFSQGKIFEPVKQQSGPCHYESVLEKPFPGEPGRGGGAVSGTGFDY